MHALALGVCSALVALGRLHVASESFALWTVAIGTELLALALMLHFVLVFSLPALPARLPLTIYGVTLVLEVANLWRGLARPMSAHEGFTSGLDRTRRESVFPYLEVSPGYWAVRSSSSGSRCWARAGRRETTGPLVGAVIAAVSGCGMG